MSAAERARASTRRACRSTSRRRSPRRCAGSRRSASRTDIVWTANVRTLRHVIEMRTAEGAEEELRLVFDKIARIMLRRGARPLPGLRPPRRRLLGARAPQGLGRSAARRCAQASIVRVRQRRAPRNTTSQASEHDQGRARRHRDVAPRPPSPRWTGLKCAIAWLRRPLRALPSELMLASSGLATICQRDQRGDRRRLGGRQRREAHRDRAHHAGASSVKPRPLRISDAVGRGQVRRRTRRCRAAAARRRRPSPSQHSASAAGTREANSARRERPVTTRSRKTPAEASPVPASTPIRIAASGPKNRAITRRPSCEVGRRRRRSVSAAGWRSAGSPLTDEEDQHRREREHERPDQRAALLAQLEEVGAEHLRRDRGGHASHRRSGASARRLMPSPPRPPARPVAR